jgi:tripartite-type tricarboxylate transporter receptor subunit TctC
VVDQVAADIQAIVRDPEVIRIMREQGIEPIGSSPRDFAQLIVQDVRQSAQLIQEFNIQAD